MTFDETFKVEEQILDLKITGVRIGKVTFNAQYIELIKTLPELEIGKPKLGPVPLPFRFKGGEGLLMPMGNKS
jgi:hypothetical protein